MVQHKVRSGSSSHESVERLRDRLANQFPELPSSQIDAIVGASVSASPTQLRLPGYEQPSADTTPARHRA